MGSVPAGHCLHAAEYQKEKQLGKHDAKTKVSEEKCVQEFKNSEFPVRFIPSEKVPGGQGEQVAVSLL